MRRANPIGAAAAVIAIGALACAALSAGGAMAPAPRPGLSPSPTADLARCRARGEAGGSDPGCQATWTEQRRRFFGQGATVDDMDARTVVEVSQ